MESNLLKEHSLKKKTKGTGQNLKEPRVHTTVISVRCDGAGKLLMDFRKWYEIGILKVSQTGDIGKVMLVREGRRPGKRWAGRQQGCMIEKDGEEASWVASCWEWASQPALPVIPISVSSSLLSPYFTWLFFFLCLQSLSTSPLRLSVAPVYQRLASAHPFFTWVFSRVIVA